MGGIRSQVDSVIVLETILGVLEWVYTVFSFAWAWVTNKEYWNG